MPFLPKIWTFPFLDLQFLPPRAPLAVKTKPEIWGLFPFPSFNHLPPPNSRSEMERGKHSPMLAHPLPQQNPLFPPPPAPIPRPIPPKKIHFGVSRPISTQKPVPHPSLLKDSPFQKHGRPSTCTFSFFSPSTLLLPPPYKIILYTR